MEDKKPIKFVTTQYFGKIGAYSIAAFSIFSIIFDKIKLDNIFKIKISSLLLSIIVSLIIGAISGTIKNIYDCLNKVKILENEYKHLKEEIDKKQRKIENITLEKNRLTVTYNNLFRDFDNNLILVKTVLDDLEIAIKDKTPDESAFLKQLYDITDIKYKHLNK